MESENLIKKYKKFKNIGPVCLEIQENKEIIKNNKFNLHDIFGISNLDQFFFLKNNNINIEQIVLIKPINDFKVIETFYNNGIKSFVFENFEMFLKCKEKFDDIKAYARLNIEEIYDFAISKGFSFSEIIKALDMGCILDISCPEIVLEDSEYLEDVLMFIKIICPKIVRFSGFREDVNIEELKTFAFENGIIFYSTI